MSGPGGPIPGAYPLGGNDPAAIGAGLGSLDPLRVSAFRREATSSKVSQHRTIVLDSIPGNVFLVPELTLAFNRMLPPIDDKVHYRQRFGGERT